MIFNLLTLPQNYYKPQIQKRMSSSGQQKMNPSPYSQEN